MKSLVPVLIVTLGIVCYSVAADESFTRIKVPDSKGKPIDATLTFSDQTRSVQIRPVKGNDLVIPYSRIAKFSYEYTKRHRVNERSLASAPLGIGAFVMLTKGKSHWLEINYDNDQDIRKTYVLRMDKHDYLHILEAIRAHTGKDAEILGNANKR
ncbi:MAG TPA: hypothetical protein VJQ54_16435 [Candidatus Sulfotelmatobacter sp.]|nr:hypothetical protein [Candidatus Sulfotelmatobacter sp.]